MKQRQFTDSEAQALLAWIWDQLAPQDEEEMSEFDMELWSKVNEENDE